MTPCWSEAVASPLAGSATSQQLVSSLVQIGKVPEGLFSGDTVHALRVSRTGLFFGDRCHRVWRHTFSEQQSDDRAESQPAAAEMV